MLICYICIYFICLYLFFFFSTGEVLFVYKDVPVNITDINDDKPPFVLVNNPVRVGLYDAYIIEKTLFCE